MAVTPERMTLAEFLKLPEVKPARELRNGVASQKMPPSGPHGSIQFWFGIQVYTVAEVHELAQAFTEVRIVLGEDTYVPDVIVYQWDRVPEDNDGNLPFYFSIPPDLAVEVMSPGQTLRASLERCRELVGHGVRVVVLVDPIRSGVHVIRPGAEIGPLREGDTVDMTDVIPDFRLAVTDILARVRPGRRR